MTHRGPREYPTGVILAPSAASAAAVEVPDGPVASDHGNRGGRGRSPGDRPRPERGPEGPPPEAGHRLALTSVLEGLALWAGAPISAVASAADLEALSCAEDPWGITVALGASPLIELEVVLPPEARVRPEGPGPLRAVARLEVRP